MSDTRSVIICHSRTRSAFPCSPRPREQGAAPALPEYRLTRPRQVNFQAGFDGVMWLSPPARPCGGKPLALLPPLPLYPLLSALCHLPSSTLPLPSALLPSLAPAACDPTTCRKCRSIVDFKLGTRTAATSYGHQARKSPGCNYRARTINKKMRAVSVGSPHVSTIHLHFFLS